MSEKMSSKVFSGMFWKFAERIGAQGVSFIISIILARLLSPEDYGVITLLLIFIDIANVFVTSGLGVALVQKKDADDVDYSSVFYFNILFSIVLYLLMFNLAPFISEIYDNSELIPLIRLLSLKLPLASINSIQQAYVQKRMLFKKFFFSTFFGTLLSGVVGVVAAYGGMGAYALVAQYLTNSAVGTIILWFTLDWKPVMKISISRLIPLIQYGWKILIASIIDVFYNNLRSFFIGGFYSSSDLAFFNQGKKFPQLISLNVNTTIDSVLLPVMVEYQDNSVKLKETVRKSIKLSSMIMWPMMIGMIAVSENLIEFLLTDKWLPCLPFLWISCIQYAFEPVQTANLQSIKALGRSDIILNLEMLKKGYGILVLLLSIRYGVMAIAIAGMTQTFVAALLNSIPNRKLLGYNAKEQILDLLPPICSSIIMGVAVYSINYISLNPLITMIIQVISGMLIYCCISYITQKEMFNYLLSIFKNKFLHKN